MYKGFPIEGAFLKIRAEMTVVLESLWVYKKVKLAIGRVSFIGIQKPY